MRGFIAGLVCGLAAIFVAGCQNDEIRSYQVPRIEAPKREARMLAAILRNDDRTWYFKLTGPVQAVGEHKEEFQRFVQSSRFSDSPDQPLSWSQVPEGWRRAPNSEIAYATFNLVPDEGWAVLTVTALGRESGSVLDNVNRWRKQLGLAEIAKADLPKLIAELKVGDATAQFIDLTGTAQSGGRMGTPPPFAAGRDRLPAARVAGPQPPKYTKPEGWTESTADMSLVSFRVAKGDQAVQITVTPLSGGGGGLLPNVNRWRAQVGLEEISQEQLDKQLRQIEVAGIPGNYVDLTGPESAGNQRQSILAVVFERDSTNWFIKMKGPAELVAKEKANFETFVKSLRFEPGTGANDG
jgi:hypothetical protein